MLELLFRRMMRPRTHSSSYWIRRNGVGYCRISRKFLHQAIGRTGLLERKRYTYSLEVMDTTWSLLIRIGATCIGRFLV
jgi:hypothetical protein